MNVKQNMKILFYLKRKKASKDGMIPIYIRITICNSRRGYSTSQRTLDSATPSHYIGICSEHTGSSLPYHLILTNFKPKG